MYDAPDLVCEEPLGAKEGQALPALVPHPADKA